MTIYSEAKALNQIAVDYLNQGILEQAALYLQKAIALDPKFTEAYFNLGFIFTKQERREDAIFCFQTVLALEPSCVEAYYNLGVLLAEQNNLEQAITCLEKSLEMQPNDADVYNSLGNCFLQNEQIDEAILCFQKALQLQLECVTFYNQFLLKIIGNNQLNRVISASIKALQIKPDWSQAYLYIGYALQQQGRSADAQNCGLGYLPAHLIQEFCPETSDFSVISNTNSEDEFSCINLHSKNIRKLFVPKAPYAKNHESFLATTLECPETFVVRIPNGRAWIDFYTTAVFASNNQLIENVSFGNWALIASSDKLPQTSYIEGVGVCLSIRYCFNYFHWMFDLLPKIGLLQQSGIELEKIDKFIVNGFRRPFQQETLNALGIPNSKIINNCYSHVEAQTLIVPSSSFNEGKVPLWACEFLRKQFLTKTLATYNYSNRIYISRKQAHYRRVSNEDEVSNFLTQFGFQTIALESLKFQEQIALFSTANIVIAPHGAGLTNLVFAYPGTKVIELFLADDVPNYYWIISNHLSLDYYYLIGESIEHSSSHHQPDQYVTITSPQNDIYVDLDSLLNLMKFANIV